VKLIKIFGIVLFIFALVGAADASALLKDGVEYELSGFLKLEKIEGGVKIVLEDANQRFPKGCGVAVPESGGVSPFPYEPIILEKVFLNGSKSEIRAQMIEIAKTSPDLPVVVKGRYHAFCAQVLGAYPGLSVENVSPFGLKHCSKKLPLKVRLLLNSSKRRVKAEFSFVIPHDLKDLSLAEQNKVALKFVENFKTQGYMLQKRGLYVAFIMEMHDAKPVQNVFAVGTPRGLALFVENPLITSVKVIEIQ
jgi:hypothetical protein